MHKNHIWLAFLSTMFLIVVAFSLMTAYEVYRYFTLSQYVLAKNTEWSLKQIGEDRYVLHARYNYAVDKQEISREETLNVPTFRNPLAAKSILNDYGSKSWIVWFSPQNPQDASLQNDFPMKALIYAAILWALFLYFLWLGFYVHRKNKRWK